MLRFDKVYAAYGKKNILSDISLECERGQLITLIGPNGCGKSTLLKCATGNVPYIEGRIFIDGRDTALMKRNEIAKKTAYLAQSKNIPDISVSRLVLHGRFPYLSYPRRYKKEDFEYAEEAMEKMGIKDLENKNLMSLSGGMRQKVYIAMALCQEADIIMLDEPGTYLDIYQQYRLSQILKELAGEGKTLLTVSHDIAAALKISDKIAVMDKGRLLFSGTPEETVKSGILPEVFRMDIEKQGSEYFYKLREDKNEPLSSLL